tara:strand:+ start:182 stop:316 length:135 start_codon:yes stop_codon:yes gene_type:complete
LHPTDKDKSLFENFKNSFRMKNKLLKRNMGVPGSTGEEEMWQVE